MPFYDVGQKPNLNKKFKKETALPNFWVQEGKLTLC